MQEVQVRHLGADWSPSAAEAALRGEGFGTFRWGNGAGYYYAPHRHDYDSVIVCLTGAITFHVGGSDMELQPGDRIDLPAGVEHAATVGASGVECLEGTR
jgi:quercetin dioxygenase-like cupin family protein